MFSQNELDSYKRVKAPAALRTRVMAMEGKKDRAFILKPSYAFSLAAILLCSVFILNILGTDPGIYLEGSLVKGDGITVAMEAAPQAAAEPQTAAFMSRETPQRSVDFEISMKEKGILTASSGSLTATDKETGEILGEGLQVSLGKDTLISWEVGFEEDNYFLSLYDGEKEEFYALTFNSDGSFTLKRT